MRPRLRTPLPLAVLAAIGLCLAGCATSPGGSGSPIDPRAESGGTGTASGATTSGIDSDPAPESRTGDPMVAGTTADPADDGHRTVAPRLRLELDGDEAFVTVSPSGRWLVTERPDQLCLRSGEDYADRECLSVDSGITSWSPQWSHHESRLAVVRAGSSRGGESNHSVWVLDIDDRLVQAVSPTDAWLAATPVPFWWDDDTLGYTWPLDGQTDLQRWTGDAGGSTGPGTPITGFSDLTIDGFLTVDDRGALVHADADRSIGIYRLASDGTLVRVRSTGENLVLAVDPVGKWVVTQYPDAHHPGPPVLVELATGDESPAAVPGSPLAFSPDGSGIVGVRTTDDGAIGITAALVPPDPTSVIDAPGWQNSVDLPPRTYAYHGIAWTDTNLVLPLSTDGEPEWLLVFPAPTV